VSTSVDLPELRILDYWRILWQRRLTVLLVVVIAVVASIGVDLLRTKVYTSTSDLLFVSQNYSSNGSSVELTAQDIATQIRLVQGAEVKAAASLRLRQVPPSPSVVQVGTTAVAAISVSSTSPSFAASAANAYARAYISVTENRFVTQQQQVETQLQQQINALQGQTADVQSQLAKAPTSEVAALTSQLGNLSAQQQSLRTQLTQIQIVTAQAPSGGQLVAPALPSKSPSSPQIATDAFLAALLGLVIGVGAALLREILDDRVRTQAQLDLAAGGLPTLGVIPRIPEWRNSKDVVLVAAKHPKSPPAEAYRGLRTSIQFVSLDRPVKILAVTSPSVGDGKTTTAANLAVSLAETGQRVVIVGCDLRKPRVHNFFGIDNERGFTSVLVDEVSLEDAVVAVPKVPNLWILPSGPVPASPSELLGSPQGRRLFDQLASEFDYVVIDCPPVLPVTDAAVVATIADAVILVCAAGNTTKRDFATAEQLLERVDAPILGVVLNTASESDAYVYYRYGEAGGYGYGYGYGYGASRTSESSGKKQRTRSRGGAHAPKSGEQGEVPSAIPSDGLSL